MYSQEKNHTIVGRMLAFSCDRDEDRSVTSIPAAEELRSNIIVDVLVDHYQIEPLDQLVNRKFQSWISRDKVVLQSVS
jgi:hypothetical protein